MCDDARVTSDATAERILVALSDAGVSTAFGLPGVHNLPFWGDLDEASTHPTGLRITAVRHEQTAAYAADGLARATGGLGVCLVTSGPGAANTLAAFGEAAASGVPLLVIASDVPEQLRTRDAMRGLLHESSDQGAWFAPLAKAVFQPRTPDEAVAAVADAVAIAMSHPRGPVYVGIPADVLRAPAPAAPAVPIPPPRQPSADDINAAVDLLTRAKRPALWIGGGVVASAADIDTLAWRLGAPVFATYAARGVLPPGHPLLVDVPAMEPRARALLADADLLLVLGSALDGMSTANWSLARPDRVIDVNLRPSGAFEPDLTIAADVAAFVDGIALRLSGREPWADSPFLIRDAVRSACTADRSTREAVAVVDAIERAWPPGNPIVCDMAVAGYWVGGYAAVHGMRQLLYPVGWGTLGYGLPAAIGVAASGTPTLAVVGDGGLAMATGELATLVQEHLPVTILVVSDSGYGMLRYDQQRAGLAERGVDLEAPDWRALGAAFRLPVDTPADADDLGNVIARSAVSGDPRLVVYSATLSPPRSTSPRWGDPDR